MLLTIIFLIINFSFISLAIIFMILEIINPSKMEDVGSEKDDSDEKKATFPKYCQYSIGFSFLALAILSLMSLFV